MRCAGYSYASGFKGEYEVRPRSPILPESHLSRREL